jgi:integrase/recombinase XerD
VTADLVLYEGSGTRLPAGQFGSSVPVVREEALDHLPEGPAGADPFWRLAAAFLVAYPDSTAKAYLGGLKAWAGWCAERGVHPFAARRHHVDTWVKSLGRDSQPATGRPTSPATIARRLSCLSKFYDYGMREVELIEHSPVANVRRPKVSEDSPTIGLHATELGRLLTAAEAHGSRSAALVSLLVYNGLRIDEALACDVDDFTYQRGHRVLRIVRKGGKASTEPLAPIVVRVLEDYVGERASGPLFSNRDRTERLSYSTSYGLIRRLAKRAGIAAADRLSPHSLRHSFATELLAVGVPLQDVQDAMGHADPRTTRRYDRSRHNLDRHPTYKMAANLRRSSESD